MNYELDFSGKVPPSVQEQIREGMERADENANPQWRHIFDASVLAAAKKKPEITSDDVLFEIESLPNPPKTHSLAAIGPAMKRAAVMGVISPTDKIVRSTRPEKRGNYHKTWRSNYFAATDMR